MMLVFPIIPFKKPLATQNGSLGNTSLTTVIAGGIFLE